MVFDTGEVHVDLVRVSADDYFNYHRLPLLPSIGHGCRPIIILYKWHHTKLFGPTATIRLPANQFIWLVGLLRSFRRAAQCRTGTDGILALILTAD